MKKVEERQDHRVVGRQPESLIRRALSSGRHYWPPKNEVKLHYDPPGLIHMERGTSKGAIPAVDG
jgi:hypothetical protein